MMPSSNDVKMPAEFRATEGIASLDAGRAAD
jgi:hypothetical protein